MQYAVLSRLPSLKDITQSINVLLFLYFNWEQPHDHANCPLDCEISSVLRWVSSPDEFTNVGGYRDSWFQLKLGKHRIFFGSSCEIRTNAVLYIFCFICPAFLPEHIIISYDVPLHPILLAHSDSCCIPTTSPLPAWRTRTASAGTRHTTRNAQETDIVGP